MEDRSWSGRCDSCQPSAFSSNENRRQAFGAETVALEHSIMSDQAQFFGTGLGYEHPVERIAVNVRQPADPDGMLRGDRQGLESAFKYRVLEVVDLDFNSSQCRLDCDLPDGRRADERLMGGVGDRRARLFAQLTVVRQPPKQDVGIEEQPHGSGLTFEGCQQVFRESLIEILFDADLAAQVSGPARFVLRGKRDQASNGFSRFCDDDLFASRSALDQPGKLGLGLVNVNPSHDWTKLRPVQYDCQTLLSFGLLAQIDVLAGG